MDGLGLRAPVRRRAFGVVLDTDIDLPGLGAGGGGAPFLRVRLDGSASAGCPRGRTVARGPGGAPWMTLARDGERRVLRIPGVGRFAIGHRGRTVAAAPAPGVPPEVFRRVLLDHVLPRALHRAGIPVLHASAVAGRRGALLFLGGTGAGKSSVAALLAVRGLRLLADDGVRLEVSGRRLLAHPSHPFLRLREPLLSRLPALLRRRIDATPGHSPKGVLDARRAPLRWARGPVPVAAAFVLARSRTGEYAVSPRPLQPRAAALALLGATFRADPWDPRAFARDLEVLGEAACRIPVHRLLVPSGPASRVPRRPGGRRPPVVESLPIGAP